jgi:hypothetical protein
MKAKMKLNSLSKEGGKAHSKEGGKDRPLSGQKTRSLGQ